MAKIVRKVAKIFGLNATAGDIRQFGSLAAGTPVSSTDPAVIQALSQWSDGWQSAILGSSNPSIEDEMGLSFVMAYQIAYIMQEGVPEYDATTTYYIGSIVQDGAGSQFISTLDTNLGNALGGDGWFPYGTQGSVANQTVGNVTLLANKRMYSPSPITLGAGKTVTCPATTIARVVGNITVPTGASLVVASGGSVGVI